MGSLDISAFRQAYQGDLLTPQDGEYQAALARWASQTVKPAGAVAYPKDEYEISAIVKFAVANKVQIAIKCGGMGPYGSSSTVGGIVIDLSQHMNNVTLEGETSLIGAGATGGQVDEALSAHERATVTPHAGSVGYAGFALGGGFGLLSGQYGLGTDNIVAATVVLANGRIVRTSKNEYPDLFWAIRGGGSNFGVVTNFEVRTYPIHPTIYAGVLVFPISKVSTVFDTAAKWKTVQAPEDGLAIILREMENGPSCVCWIYHNGDEATGTARFKAFHDLGPIATMVKMTPISELSKTPITYGIPALMTSASHSAPTGSDVSEAIKFFLDSFESQYRFMLVFQYIHMGKISSVPVEDTAIASRGSHMNVFVTTTWKSQDESVQKAAQEATDELVRLINEEGPGAPSYLNSESDRGLGAAGVERGFRQNFYRLQQIKSKYDPGMVFDRWFPIPSSNK